MACTMPRACMDVASGVRIERLRVRTLQQHRAESQRFRVVDWNALVCMNHSWHCTCSLLSTGPVN